MHGLHTAPIFTGSPGGCRFRGCRTSLFSFILKAFGAHLVILVPRWAPLGRLLGTWHPEDFSVKFGVRPGGEGLRKQSRVRRVQVRVRVARAGAHSAGEAGAPAWSRSDDGEEHLSLMILSKVQVLLSCNLLSYKDKGVRLPPLPPRPTRRRTRRCRTRGRAAIR